jgi:hypothetical protein
MPNQKSVPTLRDSILLRSLPFSVLQRFDFSFFSFAPLRYGMATFG